MPVPGEPAYVEAWHAFIEAAMGTRYPGAFDLLAMTGSCYDGETSFPTGWPGWTALGVDGAKLLGAWQDDINAWGGAFVNTQRTLALTQPTPWNLANELTPWVHSMDGARVSFQLNGLKATTSPTKNVLEPTLAWTTIGWQFWINVANGGGPLATCLKIAQESKASYVEVYAVDALNPANAAVLNQYGSR
jgi:hypothetical protein